MLYWRGKKQRSQLGGKKKRKRVGETREREKTLYDSLQNFGRTNRTRETHQFAREGKNQGIIYDETPKDNTQKKRLWSKGEN